MKSDGLYNCIDFIRQPINSIDILVLGSSHSKDGIDARELDDILLEEYGIETRTFNMSVNQMRMEQIAYRSKHDLTKEDWEILFCEKLHKIQNAGFVAQNKLFMHNFNKQEDVWKQKSELFI